MNGDTIYNGAVDNATGCGDAARNRARLGRAAGEAAALGDVYLACPRKKRACSGSQYYGEHPVIPAGKTAPALNFDSFLPFGRTRDVSVTWRGAHHHLSPRRGSRAAFRSHDLSRSAAGGGHVLPLRSFFVCARGHPCVFDRSRPRLIGKPPGTGKKLADEYNEATTISPPTNITTIGIFRAWSFTPASDS